jgi:O-methyltransferase
MPPKSFVTLMNSPDPRSRYLDLLEKSLLDAIYGERGSEMRLRAFLQRLRHPYLTRRGPLVMPTRAHTAIGATRLRHLRRLVERTIEEAIPGDYIETGVWRGGACILVKGILAAYGVSDRKVYCADTFSGLPRPDAKFPADRRDRLYAFSELAVSEETVRRNFSAYDLLDENVVFLKGLFEDTLPRLAHKAFALIRLDGDMYGSTMDALVNLYDRVSPSGFIVVDDYGALRNCAKAVHDFLDQRGLRVEIAPTDESCVWWQKK